MIVEKQCYVIATTHHPIEFRSSDGELSPYYEDAALFTETEAEELIEGIAGLQMMSVTASLVV